MVALNKKALEYTGDADDIAREHGFEALRELLDEAYVISPESPPRDADDTGKGEGQTQADFERRRKEEPPNEAEPTAPHTNGGYDGSELPPGACIDSGQPLKAFPYLVKNTIPRRGRGILVGQSGVAKTALLIHLLTACASLGMAKDAEGQPTTFFGRKIKEQVGAVMFVAEGEGEIEYRMRAARRDLGIDDKVQIPLLWCTRGILGGAPGLNDPEGKARFIEFCQNSAIWMRRNFGVRLGLYAVDTQIAAYTIQDENDAIEIAAIATDFGSIGAAMDDDCFGINVVHAGKDASKGARGSSAYRDNYDIMLMASGERNEIEGTCRNRRLTLSKNRFGPEGPISPYDVSGHVIGKDDDGEDFGGVVVYAVDRALKPERTQPKRPTKYHAQFEQAFNNAIIEHPAKHRLTAPHHVGTPEVTAVDVEHVRAEFYRVCIVDSKNPEMTADAKRAAFNRELAGQFKRYPQEEDQAGRKWIWKA